VANLELNAAGFEQTQQSGKLSQSARIDLGKITGAVHFVGIGGIGMSALARLLLARGVPVSGSDRSESTTSVELADLGARITIGHQASNIDGAGAIVVSTAITQDNPEMVAARTKGLPVWHRSDLLKVLAKTSKLIAVSGTHGKTTTTGMVAQVLLDGALDPTVVVGGIFPRIGSNAFLGAGEYFVAEADESDGTHAGMQSHIALITNIEADHLENYPGGIEQIRDYMVSFANSSVWGTVLCADDPGCRQVRPRLKGRVITYGRSSVSPDADYTYESLPGFRMRIFQSGKPLGELSLHVPGEHNKQNALAAAVVGFELGLTWAQVSGALESFSAVARRFQLLGQENDILIVDDYAHHPTEVAATLEGARTYQSGERKSKGRVVAIFQPHQPARLRDLWDDFCQSFVRADLVLLTDVYVARGAAIEGINSERFASAIKHGNVRYLPGKTGELPAKIVEHLQPGDLVLTIGAGDITKVGWEILRLLKQGHVNGRVG
jgi:UDP-N-acetylmuramate--alanine ligase